LGDSAGVEVMSKIKGFWNDASGVTVIEIVALTLLVVVVIGYFMFKAIDPVLGDIVIGSFLATAGQNVGSKFARRNKRIDVEAEAKGETTNG
jgi:Flp pilus assembly pilin Flp